MNTLISAGPAPRFTLDRAGCPVIKAGPVPPSLYDTCLYQPCPVTLPSQPCPVTLPSQPCPVTLPSQPCPVTLPSQPNWSLLPCPVRPIRSSGPRGGRRGSGSAYLSFPPPGRWQVNGLRSDIPARPDYPSRHAESKSLSGWLAPSRSRSGAPTCSARGASLSRRLRSGSCNVSRTPAARRLHRRPGAGARRRCVYTRHRVVAGARRHRLPAAADDSDGRDRAGLRMLSSLWPRCGCACGEESAEQAQTARAVAGAAVWQCGQCDALCPRAAAGTLSLGPQRPLSVASKQPHRARGLTGLPDSSVGPGLGRQGEDSDRQGEDSDRRRKSRRL